ncbi:MAG TPA: VOC family protein [Kofleriaceae bacterium]|nr:VOC family protein [Kofleriaceae bacterium]
MSTTPSIAFFEIATADLPRARAFYGELFAWKFAEPALPDAAMFDTGGVPGMLNAVPDHRGGDSTVVYITVDHVQPTYARALALGATEVIAPRPIPGKGTFAVFRDRDANRIGIFSTER